MTEIRLDAVYRLSGDIVAREIAGELIIIPLTAGIGDLEDELYTLNEIGKAVWQRLDGTASLKEVAEALALEYRAEPGEIEQDVRGLLEELLMRRIVVEVPGR